MDRYEQSFVVELKSFADAILENRPTAVYGIGGRMTGVMALARESYDEWRPVTLEEIAG